MLTDLVQLRTFVAVAEEQHLTRAAERLHLSQSAASAHVRAIEESLDMQLFVRTNRSLELTHAGEVLLRRAKILLNKAAEFTSFAREMRGKLEGNLIVGASSDPVANRIGTVVSALHDKHPLINVELCARPSGAAREGLKTGELDLGMVLGHPMDLEFTYHPFRTVQLRLAGPVAWKERIARADLAELAALPWITPRAPTLAYSGLLDQLFRDKGLELNTVVRYDTAAFGRSLLKAGMGMLLMHETYALQGEREGYLAISPIVATEFPESIVHLTNRGQDPLIRAFVDAVSVAWPDIKVMASVARR